MSGLAPLMTAWVLLAATVFVAGFFVAAPYGRHFRSTRGPSVDDRFGWVIMEAPAVFVFGALFCLTTDSRSAATVVFLVLWQAHYMYRTFIYPLTRRTRGKRMALAVVVLGFFFNMVNAYLNGRYVFNIPGTYTDQWLSDPRFVIGLALFIGGFMIHGWSDGALAHLRNDGQSPYRIPHRGLFQWISCPNYLGELIEWIGWATATWSPAGLAFALWTMANLIPRARSHHVWYRTHFPGYPAERKALIPGLW